MQTIQLPHEHGRIMEHNINEIPANQSFQTISDIFKLLSDSSRIQNSSGCFVTVKSA